MDVLGVIFALLADAGRALFIVTAGRVGKPVPGNDGFATGMAVAAMTMIPFAAPVVTEFVSDPLVLLAGFGVALLSTTIPFTLELEALEKSPPGLTVFWSAWSPEWLLWLAHCFWESALAFRGW